MSHDRGKLIDTVLVILSAVLFGLVIYNLATMRQLIKDTAALQERAQNLGNRLDNIVRRLHDMGLTIAQEELLLPYQAAVVASKPLFLGPGKWVTAVSLYDPSRMCRETFLMESDRPGDGTIHCFISGTVHNMGRRPLAFAQLAQCARRTGKDFRLPSVIDQAHSYILRSPYRGYRRIMFRSLRGFYKTVVDYPLTKRYQREVRHPLELAKVLFEMDGMLRPGPSAFMDRGPLGRRRRNQRAVLRLDHPFVREVFWESGLLGSHLAANR